MFLYFTPLPREDSVVPSRPNLLPCSDLQIIITQDCLTSGQEQLPILLATCLQAKLNHSGVE